MKAMMIAAILAMFTTAASAFAVTASTPEIDGGTAVTGLVLVSGGLLILRSRRRRK